MICNVCKIDFADEISFRIHLKKLDGSLAKDWKNFVEAPIECKTEATACQLTVDNREEATSKPSLNGK